MSLRPTQRKRTRVSGDVTGTLVRSSASTALKSAAFAPIPSASERTTTAVQPFAFSSTRTACRRSLSIAPPRKIGRLAASAFIAPAVPAFRRSVQAQAPRRRPARCSIYEILRRSQRTAEDAAPRVPAPLPALAVALPLRRRVRVRARAGLRRNRDDPAALHAVHHRQDPAEPRARHGRAAVVPAAHRRHLSRRRHRLQPARHPEGLPPPAP